LERERFVVGLVGAGIGSSATPALHETEADALGVRYAYQVLDIEEIGVAPDEVGELIQAAQRMGFKGLNVTHPCKQHVVPCLDRLSPEASAVGAVNTVVFADNGDAIGHNTDIFGFEQSFKLGLPDARSERVVVLGAGGAGAAVAYVLLSLGTRQVTIVDLDIDRAQSLTDRLKVRFENNKIDAVSSGELAEHLASSDGLVHATPVGMTLHPGVALPTDLLRSDLWIADVVYRPLETELLSHAREVGCQTLDGGGMAVFQAVRSFELFTGLTPSAERMLLHFDRVFRAGAADMSAAAITFEPN
jgi:shikimate dehydrogenase